MYFVWTVKSIIFKCLCSNFDTRTVVFTQLAFCWSHSRVYVYFMVSVYMKPCICVIDSRILLLCRGSPSMFWQPLDRTSSAEWNKDKRPSSFVVGHESTRQDIVWVHDWRTGPNMLDAISFYRCPTETSQERPLSRKVKSGCQLVESATKWKFNTGADIQVSLQERSMSVGSMDAFVGCTESRKTEDRRNRNASRRRPSVENIWLISGFLH